MGEYPFVTAQKAVAMLGAVTAREYGHLDEASGNHQDV
jgi:hypothetical protein